MKRIDRLDFDLPRWSSPGHTALTFGSLGFLFGLIFGLTMTAPDCAPSQPTGRLVHVE